MSNGDARNLARQKGEALLSGKKKAQEADNWRDKEKSRLADIDKMMRLRGLRLAKEAADKEEAARLAAEKLAAKTAAAAAKRPRAAKLRA
jgi:hypothetical protein